MDEEAQKDSIFWIWAYGSDSSFYLLTANMYSEGALFDDNGDSGRLCSRNLVTESSGNLQT